MRVPTNSAVTARPVRRSRSTIIESMLDEQVRQRAALHAALSDPHRLAIVDELSMSDRSPKELKSLLCLESNLVAHHLNVLEGLGLISRVDSQGDGRPP